MVYERKCTYDRRCREPAVRLYLSPGCFPPFEDRRRFAVLACRCQAHLPKPGSALFMIVREASEEEACAFEVHRS